MMKLPQVLVLVIFIQQALILFQQILLVEAQQSTTPETNTDAPPTGEELEAKAAPPPPPRPPPPNPLPTASYLSLDGLTLVIMFDKPVNLKAIPGAGGGRSGESARLSSSLARVDSALLARATMTNHRWPVCMAQPEAQASAEVFAQDGPVSGIQICAKLLTKKTLKLLHKYRLHNCVWPTRTQLLIQLARPAPNAPLRVTFQRGVLSEFRSAAADDQVAAGNEREVSLELQRLPLEALGVPLAPRLALTGPNQVPPCGQFSLSAHLSSPYGTRAGETVRLNWSVERVGFGPVPAGNGSQLLRANVQQQAASELQWASLKELVAANKANNLLLDSRLLQSAPQRYEFLVTATFSTSMATISLNASHQVSRIDFEAPIGTVYGSHLLAQQPFANPGQDLLLLADIQVPECTTNVKQVGLYWQVSDPRVRFEQTYAPYYLARPNSLPEQSTIEFRLNVFYGIRVKKYASSGSLIGTGDTVLDAQISSGALVIAVGRDDEASADSSPDNMGSQVELYAGNDAGPAAATDLYTYQWSCFDGKTAQPCVRNPKTLPQHHQPTDPMGPTTNGSSSSSTPRYEIGALANVDGLRPLQAQPLGSVPLIETKRQRQQVLRLPKSWLEPEAQLWFGLQRFDRSNPSHKSQSEYALLSVHQGPSPTLSIGPVLVGKSRQRATVRNPLTGSVVLIANAPAVVVGRISGPGVWPPNELSFAWRLNNQIAGSLKWSVRNVTNSWSGQQELLTELQLGKRLQVAHAHYQLQLVTCNGAGQSVAATLNVDVVPGVSQCRVGAGLSPEALGRALVVAVEHCNIPLGLSPLTYQLYMADAAEPSDRNSNEGQQQDDDDDSDYVTDSDELALNARAQPLTSPQLSPVFSLAGFGPEQLLAMIGQAGGNSTTRRALRFGARVCDQLKSCRMFFSATFGPAQLFAGESELSKQALMAAETTLRGPQMAKSLGSMIEGARRANLAGNSIAAIAILNGAINLGQRLTAGARGLPQQNSSTASAAASSAISEDRIRDLVQVAARDCLAYGSQSIQRQFHYTESGQTNLVMHAMGRILNLPHGNIELKFRAIRLLTQLTQRTINEQLNLKLNCLADFKSIQWVFESLFGTFSHYAVEKSSTIDKHTNSHKQQHNNRPGNNRLTTSSNNRSPSSSLSLSISNSTTTSSNSLPLPRPQNPQHIHVPTSTANNNNNNNNNSNNNSANSVNRKRREEAILAYLRSVRLAYRALISAAAIQLPLGDTQQFHYPAGGISGSNNNLYNTISGPRSRSTLLQQQQQQQQQTPAPTGAEPPPPTLLLSDSSMQSTSSSTAKLVAAPTAADAAAATATPVRATTVSSDIVSSLVHLSEITDSPINIDLSPTQEFGSISIHLDTRLSLALRQLIEGDRLVCRNGTASKCSTFVLAITWFAGKAPFRSLDETGGTLRVPVVELSLLSPLDGSNLMDLINWNSLAPEGLASTVTFAVPRDLESSEQQQQQTNTKYKCYKFDEDANEWARIQQVAVDSLDSGMNQPTLGPVELIRCRFKGLGAIGAFRGRPLPGEGSVGHSVALFILGAVGVVVLLSLLSCLATGSRSRSSDGSGDSDEDDESARKLGRTRHPEETTYKNQFNYPI